MAKLGKALARGVQAGLLHYGAKLERDEKQKRIDERLAKEDQFRERQLSIQEEDAQLRKDAADRQKFFDDTKINHTKLVKGLAGAGENMNMQAEALTKFFPDQRIYKFDPKGAKDKGIWGQMQVSYLDKDPVTGEVKVDELTGLPKEITTMAPTDTVEFKTRGDYEAFKTNVVSPEMYLAYASQGMTTDMAIRKSNKMAAAAAETKQGKEASEARKAKTDLDVAKAEKLRAEVESGVFSKNKKAVGSVMGLDGKDVKLSTPEVNQLINDTKSMKDKYPGINSGEAYRLSEAMESPSRVSGLQALARQVIREETPKQKAVETLQKVYRLTKQTAEDLLAEQMQGVEDDRPGFFEGWLSRNKSEGIGDQSLVDEARDAD